MPSTAKAKSTIVAQFVRLARRERLSYDEFSYVCQRARKHLGLTKPQRARTLPHLLTADELTRFFRAVQDGGNVQHEILLKLLFFTAVRVGELVRIAVGAVDLAACKIFVDQGKGRKDRYILFPRAFGLVLRAHLAAHPKNHFVFETQRWGPYTVRRVRQIVQRYREAAGLGELVHPHLFRHQMLTFLTGQKLSDAQIQLLSGHASKKSLEIYQHLSLDAVEEAYQQAVKWIGDVRNAFVRHPCAKGRSTWPKFRPSLPPGLIHGLDHGVGHPSSLFSRPKRPTLR